MNAIRNALVCVLFLSGFANAQEVTIGTYNIEHFHSHFLAHRIATSRPGWMPADDELAKEITDALKGGNDEDNWEAAQVILDPKFNPDVLVLQEGCRQKDLEFFNKRWLNEAYATLLTFPSNTNRDQHLNMLLKPGFKVIEKRDQFYQEKDSVPNDRGDRLFARGPSFVLIETPGGKKIWVGTNHQKSKSGNNVEVTQWRNRESKRTNEIMKELSSSGSIPLVFLGDMNDELGMQEFEAEGGGDAIANLVGPAENGIVLATKPLIDNGKFTFGGYWRTDRRGCIDHILISSVLKEKVRDVQVVQSMPAPLASDHYPVFIKLETK